MHVSRLVLDEFRRYAHLRLDIPEPGLRLVGRNGIGKTSILESLMLLATTRSPRTSQDRDIIRWTSGEEYGGAPYVRVEAAVATTHGDHTLEISLQADPTSQTARKRCQLDGRNVRAATMVGVLKAVLFSPEDVQLVSGPPSERRRQMDILNSQIDRTYLQSASRYQRILSQRNGLLRQFQKDGVSHRSREAVDQLTFWDEELVRHGSRLVASRVTTFQNLAQRVAQRSPGLIDDHDISLHYLPNIPLPDWEPDAFADPAALIQRCQALFLDHLAHARPEEFRRGLTTIGPQRDDFDLRFDGRSLATFGSRGQQRLGVIALKLSEGDVMTQTGGDRPVMLLDDILSELDAVHADLLLATLATEQYQLLVTSTAAGSLRHPALDRLELREITENGVGLPRL